MVVPEPVETAPDGKQHAVYVDTRTAVKVLNRLDVSMSYHWCPFLNIYILWHND